MPHEVGTIVEGKVTGITKFGAFVELEDGAVGMVHISEVARTYVSDISEHLKEQQKVTVKILNISDDGKISLSIKQALPQPQNQNREHRSNGGRPSGNFNRSGNSRQNNGNRRFSNDQRPSPQQPKGPASFEDMLAKFKQTSDEKMNDIKRGMDSKRGGFSRRSNNQW